MRIAALVDLTPICKIAVEFAGLLARASNAELILVHVASRSDETDGLVESLNNLGQFAGEGVEVKLHLDSGDFFSSIPVIVKDLDVDLVVVPTHGKVGLMQNLFGANILKLVKSLPVPSVVVQENSHVSADSFKTILFPVGPHADFDVKIKQTAEFAKMFGSEVIIYTVRNDVRGISDSLRGNIEAAKEHFEGEGVAHQVVSEEPTGFSVGYAKHILAYAKNHGVSSLSIMAKVSDENGYIGNSDKENILLNTDALPVFCANK
ncbi:MAG: universal stress protein [Flavobacteriales bacterium]|nr:universal stress protein [Flavobacteriales bacterium]MCB9192051.1 universal stress protein [Flavobacteriales bacterium]